MARLASEFPGAGMIQHELGKGGMKDMNGSHGVLGDGKHWAEEP
jgi:hypothetical protein